MPVLVCYGWPAIVYLANRAGRGGGVALPRAVMLAAGLAALGANTFVLVHQVVPQARAFERILEQSLIPMARWFNAHTPANARVAIAHVGVFGYYSERKIVDLGGLVTPELGPLLACYRYERLVSEFRFATVVRPVSTPAHRDADECSTPGACGARLQGSRARGRPALSS